jgi:hypothetical protein
MPARLRLKGLITHPLSSDGAVGRQLVDDNRRGGRPPRPNRLERAALRELARA